MSMTLTMTDTDTNMLDAALDYARRGWLVFPLHTMVNSRCSCGSACDSPGKHPRLKHGLKEASLDPTQVAAWWRRWPTANVGVVTGAESGLVVLDLDGHKGGEAALEAIEETNGRLPETVRAITGGDGMHFLFAHPGQRIRNSAEKLGPGLDVRGDGGYIVAAPSLHASGKRYQWLDAELVPVPMPAWLLEQLREPDPPAPRPVPTGISRPIDGGSAYGRQALVAEVDELRQKTQGGRNHQLNASAFSLGQLIAGGELEEHLVVAELTSCAIGIGLGEMETAKTIASGLASGKEQPRVAPARPEAKHPSYKGGTTDMGSDDAPPPEEPPEDDEAPPVGPAGMHLTDLGNARRLVGMFGADLRFVPQWKTWLVWDGARWRKDVTGDVARRAKDICAAMKREADRRGGDVGEAVRKHALRTEGVKRLEAMIEVASTEPGMAVEPGELDSDPWLVTVRNGTVDLRTGDLGVHDRKHLITKMAPIVYDPDAVNDTWDEFLEVATNGDGELIDFLQRAAGYSLSGDTGEEKLFFVHGPSASGKSTFLDAVSATMGDYARTADFETFLARKESAGGARSDVARLAGARLVTAIEAAEGRRLAEGLVKSLTGGDMVTARFMYQSEFEFRPVFKLWLAANDAPKVHHRDEAMWRRILRVPFEHVVPAAERRAEVKKILRDPTKAGPAVFAWMVRGCLAWREHGLGVPGGVEAATAAYRAQMDPLKDFLEDRCILEAETWVRSSELYRTYAEWARASGVRQPMTQRALSDLMAERGFRTDRRRIDGNPTRLWLGIRVRDSLDTAVVDEPPPEAFEEEVSDSSVTASHSEPLFDDPSVTAARVTQRDAAVTQANPTASRPSPLVTEDEKALRDAVTQSSPSIAHARTIGSLGNERHSVTASREEKEREKGWVVFDDPMGDCVICSIPCRSTDPAGVIRHPSCEVPA